MFCYSNNGFSFRAVDSNYIVQTGEVLFNVMDSTDVTEDQLLAAFSGRAAAIKAQKISELNATYQTKYNSLASQYAKAYLGDGDTVSTKQETLATLYKTYMTNYLVEKAVIVNE